MALRETCLWEHLTPGRPDRAALKGAVKVDVCVIGAGITGLSAAIHLLEQGKSVAVLEAHRTGHGGSGRNVGLVNAGLWIPPDEIEAGFGTAVGSQLNRMLGAAPSLVFSLIDKYNIDCQLRREGTLHMAHNARGEADCAAVSSSGNAVARRLSYSPARPASTPPVPAKSPPHCWIGAPAPEPHGLYHGVGECRRGAGRAIVRSFAGHPA